MLREKSESIYAKPFKEAYIKALRHQLELDRKLKYTEGQLSVKREELIELTDQYAKIIRTQNQEVNDLTEQVDRIDPGVSQSTYAMSFLVESFVSSIDSESFEKAREVKRQYQELEAKLVSTPLRASKSLDFTVEANDPLESVNQKLDQALEDVVRLQLERDSLSQQSDASALNLDQTKTQTITMVGNADVEDELIGKLQLRIRSFDNSQVPSCQLRTAWLADDATGDTIVYFYDPEGDTPRLGIAILDHNNMLSQVLHPSDSSESATLFEQYFEHYLEFHLIDDPRIYQADGHYLEVLSWQYQAYINPGKRTGTTGKPRRFRRSRESQRSRPIGPLRRLMRKLQDPN